MNEQGPQVRSGPSRPGRLGNAGYGLGVKEIVVARSSTGPFTALVYFCVIIVAIRGWVIPWQPRAVLYAVTLMVAYEAQRRMRGMKLSVTSDSVHVVNFNSSYVLDLDSVRIADEKNRETWPQNDVVSAEDLAVGSAGSRSARVLCLTDDSGIKAKVGVAPSYGSRLDEIAEGLHDAVDKMRSARDS